MAFWVKIKNRFNFSKRRHILRSISCNINGACLKHEMAKCRNGEMTKWRNDEMVEILDQCLFFLFLLVLIISVFQKENNF